MLSNFLFLVTNVVKFSNTLVIKYSIKQKKVGNKIPIYSIRKKTIHRRKVNGL